MASQPYASAPKVMTLEAFGRDLTRRRAALGNPELPRNAGANRTESKRALLAAIEATGARW